MYNFILNAYYCYCFVESSSLKHIFSDLYIVFLSPYQKLSVRVKAWPIIEKCNYKSNLKGFLTTSSSSD